MWLWSWVLTANGAFYMLIAGRRPALGWSIGFFSQSLWVIYGLQVHQYGFLASAALFAIVYGRNWYLAVKKGKQHATRTVDRGAEAENGRNDAREPSLAR